jgi:hypothetical protein
MRLSILLLVVGLLSFSCKKESNREVIGTVVTPGGPTARSFIVQIDNPNPDIYSFICSDNGTMPPVPQISCFTHIFVLNLPVNLQAPGTRIRFSKYADKGLNPIWSSIYPPRDVEVYNATLLK